MRRASRIFAWVLAGLALLLVILVVLLATFDWNRLKPTLEEKVSQALDRPFAIEGDLDLNWRREPDEPGWRAWIPWPHLSAEGLRLGNPTWAEGDYFLHLQRAEIVLSPLPLLARTVSIPRIELKGPDARLERLADGRANWTFDLGKQAEDGEDASAEPSSWTLDIGTIGFDQGHASLHDRQLDADLEATVELLGEPVPYAQIVASDASEEQAAPQDYRFAWRAKGRYKGQPLQGQGKIGGLLALQGRDLPFPVQLDLRNGATRVQVEGILREPLELGALDLRLRLSGDSLGNLSALTGVVLPDTPAYSTDGRLVAEMQRPEGARFSYRDFNGRIGQSDIHGSLTYNAGQPRPQLSGELVSNQLLFSDLAPLIGADSNAKKAERGAKQVQPADKVLPYERFDTAAWRSMDADVQFTGKRIVQQEDLPFDNLQAHLRLNDGRLRLDPLRFGMAGGTLNGTLDLDGRREPMAGDVRLSIRGLRLKQLFPDVQTMQKSLGQFNGDLQLKGTGNSVAALLGTADGQLRLAMNDGVVSRSLMELAGLNVGNYVVARLFGDDEVNINCAVADVKLSDGLATPQVMVFDTDNAVINVTGQTSLKRETLDLDIVPKSKGLRIFSLRSPLYVHGTYKNPSPGVHVGPLALRGAGLVILGTAVAPAAGVLALISPDSEQGAQCSALLEQVKAARP